MLQKKWSFESKIMSGQGRERRAGGGALQKRHCILSGVKEPGMLLHFFSNARVTSRTVS